MFTFEVRKSIVFLYVFTIAPILGLSRSLLDTPCGSWGFPGVLFGDYGRIFWGLWLHSALPLELFGMLMEQFGSQSGAWIA